MNRKGFTLVELLAVVAIIGILSGITVMAIQRYILKSKDTAYKSIAKTAYAASMDYLLDNDIEIKEGETKVVTLEQLVDGNYMDKPVDPGDQKKDCINNSSIKIEKNNDYEIDLDNYDYKVHIVCSKGKVFDFKYPESGDDN